MNSMTKHKECIAGAINDDIPPLLGDGSYALGQRVWLYSKNQEQWKPGTIWFINENLIRIHLDTGSRTNVYPDSLDLLSPMEIPEETPEDDEADRENVEQAIGSIKTKLNGESVEIPTGIKWGSSTFNNPYSDLSNSPSPPDGKQWIFI